MVIKNEYFKKTDYFPLFYLLPSEALDEKAVRHKEESLPAVCVVSVLCDW